MSWSIREQADDFFKAYQVLRKNYDSETLAIMGPSIVCLAFSVELHMKTLYAAIGIKPLRNRDGHNILKLYKGLPRTIRRKIFMHEAIRQNPFITRGPVILLRRFSGSARDYYGFIQNLEMISDSFEKWRYSHEKKRLSLTYDSSLAEALIIAIKSVASATQATRTPQIKAK